MWKITIAVFMLAMMIVAANAQTNSDTVMILPFKNKSDKPEFNWIGESYADGISDLLQNKGLNVISNQDRKIIQQNLRVPLTVLPSIAASLKIAIEAKATLLVVGEYDILIADKATAATVNVTAKVLRVKDGNVLSEDFPDGRRIGFTFTDALGNLQKTQGQLVWEILYRIDKVLYKLDKNAFPFAENALIEAANKVPTKAFEAYIKGLLTSEMDSQTRENYFKNAIRLYGEAMTNETYANAALELGHGYLNQQKFVEAIDYFSRIQPTSPQYGEAAFYIGLIQWKQKNYDQALEVLRPLAEDLKSISVYSLLGAIAVEASRAEKKNKGKSGEFLKSSTDYFKETLRTSPGENNSRFNYALALFLSKDYEKSSEQLKIFLENNQRDGEAYFLIAKALQFLSETSKADFANNQAIQFLADNNRYARLQVEWQDKQTVDQINLRIQQSPRKEFVSAVLMKKQLTPNQLPLDKADPLLEKARSLYKDGNDDEAIMVLRKILVSEPMKAEVYLILGNIHLRRGNLDDAIAQLRTALFWDNKLVMAHVGLGKIYLQRGDCLQAKNYTSSALAVDTENQDALGLQRQVERCSK